jgi:hypothetical protein
LEWTRQAGFSEGHLEDITPFVQRSLSRLFWISRLMWPGASALHRLGYRSQTQHANHRGAMDHYRALRRGLWFMGILTATAA